MDLGAPTAASDRHAASPPAACGRYQRRVTSSARDELEELGASHAPGLGEGESFRKGVETATELHPAQQRPQLRSVPGLPRWAPDKLVAGRARLAFFPRSSRGPSRRDGWLLRRKRHAHGEARPARCVRGQLRNIPIGRVGLSRSERTVGRTGHVAVALRIGDSDLTLSLGPAIGHSRAGGRPRSWRRQEDRWASLGGRWS
jgi:hypothetical protein